MTWEAIEEIICKDTDVNFDVIDFVLDQTPLSRMVSKNEWPEYVIEEISIIGGENPIWSESKALIKFASYSFSAVYIISSDEYGSSVILFTIITLLYERFSSK